MKALLAFVALVAIGCSAVAGSSAEATPTPQTPAGAVTHDDMQAAINAVQRDPQSFGGLWWDRSGWPLNVAIKSTDPAMKAKVERWVPPGASVVWRQVKHNYAELDAPQDWFMSWWNADPYAHPDLEVNGVGVDVVRNVTTFSLVIHFAWFENDLTSRYGDAVEFVIEPKPEPL